MINLIDENTLKDINRKKKFWTFISSILLLLVALTLFLSFFLNTRENQIFIIIFSSIALSILLISLLFILKVFILFYGKYCTFFGQLLERNYEIKTVTISKIFEKEETFRGFLCKKLAYKNENNKAEFLFLEENLVFNFEENKTYEIKISDSFILGVEKVNDGI